MGVGSPLRRMKRAAVSLKMAARLVPYINMNVRAEDTPTHDENA
jgi:hypothetical protein